MARGRTRADDRPGRHRLHRRGFARGLSRMTAELVTFGCRLNAYESEVMGELAARAGASDASPTDPPDAPPPPPHIVNTCAVTAEAERQARQAIRRAVREHPDARIVVTGCAAQLNPAAWAALPGVTRVLGNQD